MIAKDELRPALIVKVWNDDLVNLVVFLDGTNDGAEVDYGKGFTLDTPEGVMSGGYLKGCWLTSVTKGDKVGQWSWVREK